MKNNCITFLVNMNLHQPHFSIPYSICPPLSLYTCPLTALSNLLCSKSVSEDSIVIYHFLASSHSFLIFILFKSPGNCLLCLSGCYARVLSNLWFLLSFSLQPALGLSLSLFASRWAHLLPSVLKGGCLSSNGLSPLTARCVCRWTVYALYKACIIYILSPA